MLTNLRAVMGVLGRFLGYFSPLFLGCILAYLMNPMAKLFDRTALKWMKKEKLRWGLSIALTIVVFLLVLQFLLGTLVPQLAGSVSTLLDNMDSYLAALRALTERMGLAGLINLDQIVMPSGDMVATVVSFLKENADQILSFSTAAGKTVINWLIAFILSIYLLAAKDSLKSGVARLLHALTAPERGARIVSFFSRCDQILSRYIVYTLLDALIYVICAFILQLLDGYVIKPKLFGDSLGVSGLLILTAVIVCGNMFGIIGMLLAIPLAAIMDYVYKEELLPALERRRAGAE